MYKPFSSSDTSNVSDISIVLGHIRTNARNMIPDHPIHHDLELFFYITVH